MEHLFPIPLAAESALASNSGSNGWIIEATNYADGTTGYRSRRRLRALLRHPGLDSSTGWKVSSGSYVFDEESILGIGTGPGASAAVWM